MGENSKIEWTHHTFNPWRGCTKVSSGCANCYAETQAKRNPAVLGVWGPSGSRVVASESMWREPLRWDREAAAAGERRRVFCASLADVFEAYDTMRTGVYSQVRNARVRLFELIEKTPNLDWLLLTKRPQNILWQITEVYRDCRCKPVPTFFPNVWFGTSIENQAAADARVPELLQVGRLSPVLFLSGEPLLGPVNLDSTLGGTRWIGGQRGCHGTHRGDGSPGCPTTPHHHHDDRCGRGIDWVIVGGESGSNARPMHPDWARSLRDQCVAAGVAYHWKQWGEWFPSDAYDPDARSPAMTGRDEAFVNLRGQVAHSHSPFDHGAPCDLPPGFVSMVKVGKKAAGRLLDGREWNEFPQAKEAQR